MLRRLKKLKHYAVATVDGGHIGWVVDTYFDDRRWAIRYLVVDNARWLTGRRVLIPSSSLRGIEPGRKILSTSLSRAQVAECPQFDSERPVSRQRQVEFSRYYGIPYYWMSDAIGSIAMPTTVSERELDAADERQDERDDPHLRSAEIVTHYHVRARNAISGRVTDALYQDGTWRIGYVVVATRSRLLLERTVLVPVGWVDEVNWSTSSVEVGLRSDTVKLAPDYDPSQVPDAEYLTRLAGYYGAPLAPIGAKEPTENVARTARGGS